MTAVWVVVAVVVIVLIAAAMFMAKRQRLRPLPEESKARYAQQWRDVEARFLDHPQQAVGDADRLAGEILRERGARIDDDGHVPGDLKRAREESRSDGSDASDTEGARRALVSYRRIVDDAIGTETRKEPAKHRPEVLS